MKKKRKEHLHNWLYTIPGQTSRRNNEDVKNFLGEIVSIGLDFFIEVYKVCPDCKKVEEILCPLTPK